MHRPLLRRIGRSGRARRRATALALLAAVAVVMAIVLSRGSRSTPSSSSSGAASSSTATVRRRDLVETDTESGTISYADPQTVYNRLSGTITWLPRVGQLIRPGHTLYRIDGEPVILMDGSSPAYRTLDASDPPGADIEELNRNLARLGFNADGIVIDDVWQTATTDGVELFHASLGEDETGRLTLGQIVFLPGDQVISALVGTVGTTGGGSAAGAGGSAADTSTSAPAADTEFVSLEHATRTPRPKTTASRSVGAAGSCSPAGVVFSTTTSTTTTTTTAAPPATTATTPPATTPCPASATLPTGSGHTSPSTPPTIGASRELSVLTALLRAEAAQLKAATAALKAAKAPSSRSGSTSSASNSSNSSNSGGSGDAMSGGGGDATSGGGGNATAILQTTSRQLIVTVDLSASAQSEATVGESVSVELPSGQTVRGTITAVSPVAQNASSNSGSGGAAAGGGASGGSGSTSTVPVTIKLKLKGHHRDAGLDQATVSVNFAEAKAKHVLSVPVTALLATSGGGYAVQEATAPYKLLTVSTGLFAAGYVQISGSGIYPGLLVTDSRG